MLLKIFIVLQFVIGVVFCYNAVIERTETVLVDKKYLEYARFFVKRYSRQSPYYLNIEGQTKHTWDNNVSIVIEIKEKLSNMYKPSFINFRFGLCNLISKDLIFGTMLRHVGLICPVPAGEYKLHNLTIFLEDFPNVIPIEHGRALVMGAITATNEIFYKGYVYFSIIKSKPKEKPTRHATEHAN